MRASVGPTIQIIREHARQAGFPADRILEVRAIIDPTTAEPVAVEIPVAAP